MDSNKETAGSSKQIVENEDSLQDLQEIELTAVSNIRTIEEFSLLATQNTLTKPSIVEVSSSNKSLDSFLPNNNSNVPRPACCAKECKNEKLELPTNSTRESTTQTTPPYRSLIRTIPRGSFQISSVASSRSGPKSEILTMSTDYYEQSPNTRNIVVDPVDQRNQNLQLPRPENLSVAAVNEGLLNIREPPPTYSTVYSNGTPALSNWRPFRSSYRSSFVAPTPPPSYAQTEGICLSPYSMEHLISVSPSTGLFFSSRPAAALCPRCMTIIRTNVEFRQSTITHISAFLLCLCGCWPCCMIPYCGNLCKSADHYCPICHAYLGTYTPW